MPGEYRLPVVARTVALAVSLLPVLGCATIAGVDDEDRILPYACSDVVVTGRIQNGEYHPVEDAGDLLGHGWVDAVIKVDRRIKGPDVPSSLPVDYFAHATFREDLDFLFVLKPMSKGRFEIRTAQVMELHPRLAAHCDQMG